MSEKSYKPETLIAHLGRNPRAQHGAVNPPVYHASTIIYEDLETFEARRAEKGQVSYGRSGTPTTFALEDAIAALQGGSGSVAVPSGLAAVSCSLLALLEAGDHILVTDSAYHPTRRFCDEILRRFGVETSYYDPTIGDGIDALMRPNTRVVFTESPGSLTFEIQDVPAIAAVAHARDAVVVMDTTWATPLHFRPFEKGVDVAVDAGTKYVVGHSDAMLGLITANQRCEDRIRKTVQRLGICPGPDDVYLALRGLRTLAVRLARHQANALRLADWLATRPEVARVLHPARSDHPGHDIWRRDFSGASGLFSVILKPAYSKAAVAAMIEGLELFGIGASWGGYESLAITAYPERMRTAVPWEETGRLIRLHAGLEDPDDLIADLAAGFDRLNGA